MEPSALLLSLVFLSGVFADPDPDPEPEYGYGGGGYMQEHGHGGGMYRKTGYYHKKTGYSKQTGRSCGKLSPPMNSVMKCSAGFCVATCFEHHVFPSGETSLNFACRGGIWLADTNVAGGTIPNCSPSCIPLCQNGGSCVSPNTCNCPDTFYGPYCQYEKKPCFDFPPTPMNAHKVCAADSCTMACVDGHTFQDGSSVATVICKEGEWVPARKEWLAVPDCSPTCTPVCQNGGNCIGHNLCQCPQDFRGPRCEFSKEVCDIRKLGFNGNYKCSGDDLKLKCHLECPVGMKFSSPPATTYSCLYESGIFKPSTVPNCVFETETEDMLTYIFNGQDEVPVKYRKTHESNKTSTYVSKPSTDFGREAVIVEKKKPKPGTCLTWKREHFKTFDGKIISFKSDCLYTLVTDVDNSFHVQTPIRRTNCTASDDLCSSLTVYVNDKQYQLMINREKKAVVKQGTESMAIPAQLAGMKVELGSDMVKASLQAVGVIVLWNFKDVVEIKVAESNWNKTKGLCGSLDGYTSNDLTTNIETYASDARILTTGDVCQEEIMYSHPCSTPSMKEDAQQFCSALLNNKKLSDCSKTVSVKEYYEACLWDFCSCNDSNKESCGCQSVEIFVRDCVSTGVSFPSWRDDTFCPLKCSGGREYKQCGGETPCGGAERESLCEEGCFCPSGTYVHNDTCVSLNSCPCQLRGREFRPGTSVPMECNTCTCVKGQWSCTERECGAQCEAVGDPHYKTFDKKTYDFMGKCSYYLLKMDNYSIEAENVPCDGAISQELGFLPYAASSGMPSCTKTAILKIEGNVIKLKQGHEVTVNGEDVMLPITVKGTYISQASSIFIRAELPDGVEVWWDGIARLYINAPPSLKGKTKGLCGTFNNNQRDDFLTPEGDVEQDPISFANKWKTKDSCENDVKEENKNPCDANVQNKAEAEKLCSHITSNLFLDCHFYVDPITYYQNCLYDMCSCSRKKTDCFCPIISAYVKECASHGIPIEWRSHVRECGLQCPRGQVYETCGKACSRSCTDLSREQKCSDLCLEGCNCPPGYVLDVRGVCILISQCPCIHNGLQYPPGHAEIRPASKGLNLCKCVNAIWECQIATSEEVKKYQNNSFEDIKCSATKNQVYSHCEPPEPVTCQNMHTRRMISSSEGTTPAICYGGCVCKKGYILDSITKECVHPEECPCHHGGKSYKDGDQIQELCNTCVCNMGKWECTDHHCSSTCTTWGDSHFKTFDGKLYDFQGTCDYVLAKGSLSKTDWFTVTLEMTSCGSSGISCTRSVKLTIATDGAKEIVSFEDGKAHLSESSKRIKLREAGLFLFAEVLEMGLVIQWDKATRVTIRADPKWKGKMKGLCGNYNDNSVDDFQTPSGGVSEVSSQLFGDSWKLHDYCPQSQPIKDACAIRPHRKSWAVQKCSILKSNLFAPCHSEVPPDFYLNKCIFDTCGCDEGGDCECLCTTIAAYAQECNAHGVPIKWRTQELCPMQCDETCSTYSPCVPTCPTETCDNFLNLKNITEMCKQDTCVEGCQFKKCKEGEIYFNSSKLECVPSAICKPVCMTVNGRDYYEGDLMEGDDCYSCYCSRNNKTCTGLPCTTLPPTVPSTLATTVISNDKFVCISGWTGWINSSPLDIEKFNEIDSEPLPVFTSNQGIGVKGPQCQREHITDIRCRTIGTHKTPKETMEDVECSLEKGLFCKNGCSDYEIQVLCQCENKTTPLTTVSTATSPSTVYLLPRNVSTIKSTVSDITLPSTVAESTTPTTLLTSTSAQPTIISTFSGLDRTGTTEIYNEDTAPTYLSSKPTPEQSKTEATVGIVKTTLTPIMNLTTTVSVCPEGQVWDECSVKCDQLCLYYEYTLFQSGICGFGQKCTPGCRDKNRPECKEGYRWRDEHTCVKLEDCICRSFTGEIVKPGKVVKESACKSCQCLNNHYSCDEWFCDIFSTTPQESEELISSSATGSTIILVSDVTPPVEACKDNRWLPLLKDLPKMAFSSSSDNADSRFSPEHVKMNSLDGSWRPGLYDKDQFLKIDLGRPEVIYGLTVKGDIFLNEYVKNYRVLYSMDGIAFSYVTYQNRPQVFKGPSYHLDSQFQMFIHPIEARYVRINPLDWVGSPAMKIELYGCEPLSTSVPTEETPSTTAAPIETTLISQTTGIPTTSPPVCTDKMSNYMNDGQIKVSSSKEPVTANLVSVYNDEGWTPLISNPDQWLQFDFFGERTLTGVMTSGGGFKLSKVIPSWVMTYNILYSHDEKNWSPVLDTDGTKKLFYGNKDNTNSKTNIFPLPIRARYIRIAPVEWHNSIVMRAQMLGCYEPYPILTTTTVTTTTVREDCNVCSGVTLSSKICPCLPNLWWDGEQCGVRAQCPCVVGFMTYSVGTTYDNEQCEQCTCTLNGISQCKEKECPPCSEGLKKSLTSACECTCKPCPEGTKLCPTSNICINETLWCDGISDCGDDEVNCSEKHPRTLITTPTTELPTTEVSTTVKPCPAPPICGPGSKLEKVVEPQKVAPFWSPFGNKSKWGSYFKGNTRSRKGYGYKGLGHKRKQHKGIKTNREELSKVAEAPVCDQYICTCLEKPTECPPGSKLIVIKAKKEGECDQFDCFVPPDKVCKVTGRTFKTFDGTEYKYDICNHTIVRDRLEGEWDVKLVKECPFIGPCNKYLVIRYYKHTIILYTDQSIVFDGYAYTVPQMQKIGAQTEEFTFKQVNNKFIIFSSSLGFSIIWDSQANIKVVVPGTKKGEVDGLCGLLDDNPVNDKQKPNGELAKTSIEFGNSWGDNVECETKVCPVHLQKEAFEMCKAIREDPLSRCGSVMNIDKIHSQCVEAICLCSENTNNTEACRCDAILKAVTECQDALPDIDLTQWRIQNDCPASCPPGLIFKECYKHTCEPCCAELMTPDACPETNECFPGCYCPDGYVRKFEECVKPAECRDCICEGYGGSRFVTFDKVDYNYAGNCTHVLAETDGSLGPQFKVLTTNRPCEDNPSDTCHKIISILYKDYSIQAINNKDKTVSVKINNETVILPKKEKWVSVSEMFGKGILIQLPTIQLDLEVFYGGRNFKLKLPSHFYANRTRGLCGKCNVNDSDDLTTSNGTISENINDFGQSWQLKDLPPILEKEDSCSSEVFPDCLPPPPDKDDCLLLMEGEVFGKCHPVVDPAVFVANCHKALCNGATSVCRELEAYARECQDERVCLKWRSSKICPYTCPPGLIYEACGLGCTETCDNYELYRKSPEKCQAPRGDTCICPSNKVVKNGTCVAEEKCTPCDNEGHYPGDTWKPDLCTECTCTKTSVHCQRIECPKENICKRGFKSVTVVGTENDCCPKVICVPLNETCPPPKPLKCGPDQLMKLEADENGCNDFICVCKPKEECANISSELQNLEEGFVALMDNNGCCSFINKTCQPALCPTKSCEEFLVPVKKGDGKCCPIMECEIPEDHCLYEYVNEYNEGNSTGKRSVLKRAGDEWKDGPCITCECKPGSKVADCKDQVCATPPESESYVFQSVNVNNKCCPIYKRTACKHENKIYQVGESWQNSLDFCINGTCTIGANGEVVKVDSVQKCNKNCEEGWKYFAPPEGSKICCGECKPVACVINNTVHDINSIWQSDDNCTSFTCLLDNNQVQVVSSKESCPAVDDCPKEDLYFDGCCRKCNLTKPEQQSDCSTEPVPLNATIKMIQVINEEHGPCVNSEPIVMNHCKGVCDSSTEFDWTNTEHISKCLCCQAINYEKLDVALNCADGYSLKHSITNPTSCQCLTCQGSFKEFERFSPSKKRKGSSVKGR